ncbi:MAG: hypothetical protein KAX89_06225 [Propionivibrio sp.]|nr:hypothetical protein [Propionivibrio sp.]
MTPSPTNPNNCGTCDYEKDPQGTGYCYMWEKAPDFVCHQHSLRRNSLANLLTRIPSADAAKGAAECN